MCFLTFKDSYSILFHFISMDFLVSFIPSISPIYSLLIIRTFCMDYFIAPYFPFTKSPFPSIQEDPRCLCPFPWGHV